MRNAERRSSARSSAASARRRSGFGNRLPPSSAGHVPVTVTVCLSPDTGRRREPSVVELVFVLRFESGRINGNGRLPAAQQVVSALARAARAAGVPTFSPHDLRHRKVSMLHAGGVSWARIGEQVGHGDLVTTARTYTHVVADEAALDYEGMLTQ